jgi:3-hydroxyacyl-CoA dehydrogenase/enoyl-CoA hydratase/3-hydroxybutyryl-CoA epimerase
MKNIALEARDDGIGVATLDMPDRPFNVFSERMMDELEATLDRACNELRGLVIRSGKGSFAAGADLVMIKDFANMRFEADWQAMRDRFSRLGKLFRRIEKAPIPIVAAINGLALGGGLELAMACHGRVCVDSDSSLLGLPEVGLGLLPGAGGTQRLPRLIGIAEAVKMLLDGAPATPVFALEHGLVDLLASEEQLLDTAVRMAGAIQPGARWDQPDWQLPQADVALLDSSDWQQFCIARGGWSSRPHDLYPAVAAIIDCVGRGVGVSFDAGCDLEWDIFVDLMSDPVAANMVVTCFLNRARAKGADESLQALSTAVSGYLASSGVSTGQVARAARAVDAGLLVERAGVDTSSVDGVPSQDERSAGLAMLGSIAIEVWKRSGDPHDRLDAAAVLAAGWPPWTGGPIAYLAMLQRGELSDAHLPAELITAVSAIEQPLKTGASYTRSGQVA